MIAELEAKRDEIAAICREFDVLRLEVFGSASVGPWNPATSDVDFLVTYRPDWRHDGWMTEHYVLQDRLSEALGRPVDLVMAKEHFADPYFDASVNASRQAVYGAA
jgi:predicted nucleotidyltransferase